MAEQLLQAEVGGLAGIWENKLKALRTRRWLIKLLCCLVLTALAMYLLVGVVFGIGIVHGNSMEPTLQDGDLVLFFRFPRSYGSGDIVLAAKPNQRDCIKRVVGIPGETVNQILDGQVFINGEAIHEPYIYEETHKKTGVDFPMTLADGEYFLLGDHRENSHDSRNYGAVQESEIYGKVILTLQRPRPKAD